MKRRLLLYCQHSLGMGHFVRSIALAEALAERFDVVFFNGGPVPMAVDLPQHIRFIHLPPLRMTEDGSLEGAGDVGTILARRREAMLSVAAERPAAVLVVELYPFGRKKFASEIDPLIAVTHRQGGKVVCSVRDLLVTTRADQARHDQRAADRLNAQFDLVLVHSDERVFQLGASFRPERALQIPVHHTGFVTRPGHDSGQAGTTTLVTAGGGVVGRPLYEAAIAAQPLLWRERGWPMVLVAGPLLPEADWQAICAASASTPGLTLVRALPSMRTLLAAAGRVVSQCGYNSALEILQARVPVLFVPFARGQESEQTARAQAFDALGLAGWLPEEGLDGESLARRLLGLPRPDRAVSLDLRGAERSAQLLDELAA